MGRGFKRTIITFDKDGNKSEFTENEYKRRMPKSIPFANGLVSFSAGVANAREARKMNQEVAAAGIHGVRYCERNGEGGIDTYAGDLVFESRQARNAEMMRRGLIDRDAGYGDFSGR